MTVTDPIPRLYNYGDSFELPRQDAQFCIQSSAGEQEHPELVRRARQIHGISYVEYGYFDTSGQLDDGSLVDELDGTRSTDDGRREAHYLLASPLGSDLYEGTASVRLLDIGKNGEIDDLPTYKYFTDIFSVDTKQELNNIVNIHGNQGIREVAALSTIDPHDHRSSLELMRALVQNSMIKRDAGHTEVYLASLTDKSLKPVLQFICHESAEVLSEPTQIFSEDPRARSIQVTPVLMDLSSTVRNVMSAIEQAQTPALRERLENHLRFLVDGLSDDLLRRYVAH